MNYFVTHCDINFLKYAERLFETLSLFSTNKIIFYTVDFTYKSKFNNVIPIEVKSKTYLANLIDYSRHSSKQESVKAYNVFLKPFLIKELLYSKLNNENNFCYLDADCLAIKNCDKIFDKKTDIIDYPLFNRCCHEFMVMDGRGDPFIDNGYDLNYCLEADLMKLLNIDINLRKQYVQTGVFLFNKNCKDFIDEWALTCSKKEIVENWKRIAPFHEETVVNCLLWKKDVVCDLCQSLINLPYNTYNYEESFDKIKEMLSCLEDLKDEDYFIGTFCRIPSKTNIKNLFFYHGKISDTEYDYLKNPFKDKYLLKINSNSLGDTLAATPTLRKLYNSYNKKIDVITHHIELFKNNKYVNKVYSFSEIINENSYKEIFNTFLGVGGKKNDYGVEKKHNTIDIRQFHAIDLGFMLNEKEMEYDYIPDAYAEINDLPQNYICLHVANTWPSRTYSDKNWQDLINLINEKNISVVLIGKNSHESGFYNINKPTKNLSFKKGLDLTNKLTISQCWHVINKSLYFITMDSGLLHLAGTTDTNIIQLGSSINNKLRAPYRNNSQDYKYKYVSGSCGLFCASDIKYGVKEWKTIQGIPPLIKCLENKNTFECHPAPISVMNEMKLIDNSEIINEINENYIEVTNFDKNECIIHYKLIKQIDSHIKIKIIDNKNRFIIHREVLKNIIPNVNFWTSFSFAKKCIHQDISIIFELSNKIVYQKIFQVYEKPNFNIFSNYLFDSDVELFSYLEIFYKNLYEKNDIAIKENDIVVDIGSNVGAFIKYADYKKAKMIYACEPNPNCINIINKYYKQNKNLILNKYAISDKDGKTFLQIDQNSITSVCSKILESKANAKDLYDNASILCTETVTFKNFIKINNIDFIDFLKIDCEGGEVFIFIDENKEFFQKNIKKIVLEFHNEKKINIINFLKSANFDIYIDNLNNETGMIYAKNKLIN
jgi:FkbM family methyltransferase